MGWTSGFYSREVIRNEVKSDPRYVKSCWVGNDLWVIYRNLGIFLVKCQRWGPGNWAYKDMDEASMPFTYSCPLGYLAEAPDPQLGHSTEWRQRVRRFHASKKARGIILTAHIGDSPHAPDAGRILVSLVGGSLPAVIYT